MNSLTELKRHKVLVVGLGRSGMSVVRFLSKHGVNFSVVDKRINCEGLEEIKVHFPDIETYSGFESEVFEKFSVLVLSPGVALEDPAIHAAKCKGAVLIGDIELFSWVVNKPVLAVTGTNGKSTVVAMLGEIGNYANKCIKTCGNFGDPVLDFVDADNIDAFAVELSSFQLETTFHLRSVAACVLNISEDHMDRYFDLNDYIAVKQTVYHLSDCFVVNRNDKNTWPRKVSNKNKIVYFAKDEPLQKDVFGLSLKQGRMHLMLGDKSIMDASNLKVVGIQNAANTLAAIAMAREIGIEVDTSRRAMEMFSGLPHRVEFVCKNEGVSWFNDSKGTNVGATVTAVKGMAAPVVLIAGGEGKGADFTPLTLAAKECIKAAVLIGRDASKIADSLGKVNVPVMYASTMNEAVKAAKGLAVEGDVVLLSPACASFDMFRNFEERGEIFVREVLQEVA